MSDQTQELVDAKLATVEAKLESRLVGIEGKLDRMFDRLDVVARDATEAKDAANRASVAVLNIKWHILFAALGTLGLLLAAWALWAQGVDMMSGFYESIISAKQGVAGQQK